MVRYGIMIILAVFLTSACSLAWWYPAKSASTEYVGKVVVVSAAKDSLYEIEFKKTYTKDGVNVYSIIKATPIKKK